MRSLVFVGDAYLGVLFSRSFPALRSTAVDFHCLGSLKPEHIDGEVVILDARWKEEINGLITLISQLRRANHIAVVNISDTARCALPKDSRIYCVASFRDPIQSVRQLLNQH